MTKSTFPQKNVFKTGVKTVQLFGIFKFFQRKLDKDQHKT
jgi:hypothetical protein